jgi:transposase-like protein
LAFVSWKDHKAILHVMKAIYHAETADMARVRPEEFEAEWGKRVRPWGQRLGARRAILRFRAWDPQDDLDYQCGRGPTPIFAQDH